MKVLHVNCVYKKGSTGKIVNDIHVELKKQNIESVVCYGRGDEIKDSNVYKFCKEFEANLHTAIIRTGLILNYGGSYIPTQRLINIINQERPDIVHVHCINGSCVNIYKLFAFLATSNTKTVITHHAEFYYTGSCEHAYNCKQFMRAEGCKHCARPFVTTRSKTWDNSARAWKNMYEAINKFSYENLLFTAVSPWLKERSALSPIVNRYRCEVVMNGVDASVFYNKTIENIIDKRLNKHFDSKVLFVGAHFNPSKKEDNKGGWYVVELAKQMPKVLFVVVALRSIDCTNLPPNIVLWGASKDQKELASLYCSADLTLITSKRETFSMICAESLCCGTPVVGFKAGGPESIAIPEYTDFVDYGNIEMLEQSMERILSKKLEASEISQKAADKYSRKVMVNNYMNVYKQITQCT